MKSFIHNSCTFLVLAGVLLALLIAVGFIGALFGAPVLDRF